MGILGASLKGYSSGATAGSNDLPRLPPWKSDLGYSLNMKCEDATEARQRCDVMTPFIERGWRGGTKLSHGSENYVCGWCIYRRQRGLAYRVGCT